MPNAKGYWKYQVLGNLARRSPSQLEPDVSDQNVIDF